ncbi:hypothetical protein [Candidatus Symbiobacter mobilis]|uniref:Uncharacterized protein n=1 Tax=Candidatus Symbiobacter mobilis CR TaxID=946483 RepID=U5N3Z2_9BURK|nr:hypothetical protein [Candidatus Symbiobacter mobilis]AGX86206.1 hypothetical protein Cenrod_0071 [Candidatus Symbiobacter mobilis CR]
MFARDIVKAEIDRLDDQYIDLLFKIISQFPHRNARQIESVQSRKPSEILIDIAKSGGLGIKDPIAWQIESRSERTLPLRSE